MTSRTPTTPAGLGQTLHLVNFLAEHKLVKKEEPGGAQGLRSQRPWYQQHSELERSLFTLNHLSCPKHEQKILFSMRVCGERERQEYAWGAMLRMIPCAARGHCSAGLHLGQLVDIPGYPGSGRGDSLIWSARTPEHQQEFLLCRFVLSHPPPRDLQVPCKWLVFTKCTPEGH